MKLYFTTPQGKAFLYNRAIPKWCQARNNLVNELRAERGINYTFHLNIIFTHQGRKFYNLESSAGCNRHNELDMVIMEIGERKDDKIRKYDYTIRHR